METSRLVVASSAMISQRDGHALAQAAGKLARIAFHALRRVGKAGHAQHLDGAGARFVATAAAMRAHGVDDLVLDRDQRIERRGRILEDHGDLGTANTTPILLG